MPPTTNKLYQKRKGGMQALSDDAKAYREEVRKVVVEQLGDVNDFPTDLETVYGIDMTFYAPLLQNPGWFRFFRRDRKEHRDRKNRITQKAKVAGEREAETRYKRIDVDNRLKFLQDCLIKALGIHGDEQVFEGSQRKCETSGEERAEVEIYVLKPDRYLEAKCQSPSK